MKTLTLKNYFLIDGMETIDGKPTQVKSLTSWLLGFPLHGKELRLRNRFVKSTQGRGAEIEEERARLLDKHGKKDKDGKLISTGQSYLLNDTKAFEKDWDDYCAELYVIDVTPANAEEIEFVKTKINASLEKDSYQGKQSLTIEDWADAFNGIVDSEAPKEAEAEIK